MMSIEQVKVISKNLTVPISLGMLGLLILGVWHLRGTVESWRGDQLRLIEEVSQLNSFMADFSERPDRWTFLMEREIWNEVAGLNDGFIAPDVFKVRDQVLNSTRRK